MIWLACENQDDLLMYQELIQSLRVTYPEKSILITGIKGNVPKPFDDLLFENPPKDSTAEMRGFLEKHKPSVILWSGGQPPSTLETRATKLNIPIINTQARADPKYRSRTRIWAGSAKRKLSRLRAVFPLTMDDHKAFSQIGLNSDILKPVSELRPGCNPLVYQDEARTRFVQAIGTRPVWLAHVSSLSEAKDVLIAQKLASRYLMRLLLVLVPENERLIDPISKVLEHDQIGFDAQSERPTPSDDATVFLASNQDDLGLLYSVSPLSFLGGFGQGAVSINPLHAANLGSAIIFGTNIPAEDWMFRALQTQGAAVQVGSSESLAEAVCQLSFPDKAAEMAMAGWAFATQGAEATDRIVELISEYIPNAINNMAPKAEAMT